MHFISGTPPSLVLMNANDSIDSNITESLEQDWAKSVHKNIITNALVLSLYLVIGVAGNSLVLAVYKTQLKHASAERYFIPVLAMSDMLSTIFGSINNMAWDLMSDNFTNTALCKYFLFTVSNTAYMSILLLLCIAFQRYLLICRHHSLSLKHRRLMIGLSFVFANGLALPFAFFYGINDFYNDGKLIGTRCGRLQTSLYLPGAIYAVSFVSLMVLTVMSLVFFYGRVACTIFEHFKSHPSKKCSINPLPKGSNEKYQTGSKDDETEYQTEYSNNQDTCTEIENITQDNKTQIFVVELDNHSIDAATDNTTQANKDGKTRNSDTVHAQLKSNSILSVKVVEDQSSGVSSGYESHTDMTNITPNDTSLKETSTKKSKHNHQSKRNRQIKNKFSMMFIVITSVSLFCYIPVGVIVLLEGVFPDFWDNLSSTEFIVVAWLYHTYIINSIVNPIVYAFLDTEFYTGLKALFANCCTF